MNVPLSSRQIGWVQSLLHNVPCQCQEFSLLTFCQRTLRVALSSVRLGQTRILGVNKQIRWLN